MFYDLLTGTSNEYFSQGKPSKSKKALLEEDIDVKVPLKDSFDKTNKNSNQKQFFNKTANKMTVKGNRKGDVKAAPLDEREEVKMCKKTTPSLEQEMNLARRACWCNNRLDDINGQQQEQLQQCCDNCFKHLHSNNNNNNRNNKNRNNNEDVDNNENVNNDNEDENGDENEDEYDETDVNAKTTTVLIGAKNFSKNIYFNSINSNAKTDNDNDDNNDTTTKTKTKNVNSSNRQMLNNTTTATTTTTNSLSKRKNIKHKNQEANNSNNSLNLDSYNASNSTTTTTTTTTSTFLTTSKEAVNSLSTINDNNNDDSCVNTNKNNNNNCNNSFNKSSGSNLMAHLRVMLLQMWLAFVEFCDKNTIKPNDPRFAAYRHNTDVKIDEKKQQQQKQQQQTNTSSSSTAKTKKPFHLKLLTNKKLIFLFIVCVFFSCVNRIEARPNLDNSNNELNGGVADNAAAAAAAPASSSIGVNGGEAVKSLDNKVNVKQNNS